MRNYSILISALVLFANSIAVIADDKLTFDVAIGMLEDETTTEKDRKTAITKIQDLANSGFGVALNEIGAYYAQGINGFEVNCTKAIEYFTKAWNAKEIRAAQNLAVLYRNGSCMKPDSVKAMEWCRKGAEAGYKESMHDLGLFYLEPRYNQEIDSISALGWFRKAAEAGYGPSMYQLARFYYWKRNNEEFRYWIKKGADAEDMDCMHGYGLSLVSGTNGFPKDENEAAQIFKKNADLFGFEDSALELAKIYNNQKREQEALHYYEMAASQGNIEAMYQLALYHGTGKAGLKIDNDKAFMILKQAYSSPARYKSENDIRLECGWNMALLNIHGACNRLNSDQVNDLLLELAEQGHPGAVNALK